MSFGTSSGSSSSGNIGENWSSQSSSNQTASGSTSTDFGSEIWGGQSSFLQDLFKQAQMMNQNTGGMAQAQNILGTGIEGIQDMMNPGMNPMMDVYSRKIGEQFNEQIMPGIRTQATGMGQRGGARQGIAEGLAAGRAGQQIQDFGAQVYDDDRNRMLQAMSMIPGAANLGMSIPWFNLQQYGGLLGDPTSIDLGGESSSWSTGSGGSTGSSYGYNVGGSEGDQSGVNIGIPLF